MKRLDRDRLQYQNSAAIARWHNSLRRKNKIYQRTSFVHTNALGQEVITAPDFISIYEFEGRDANYYKTMVFLDQIRSRYKVRSCLVDFGETKKISAAALVVVYAAIEIAGAGRSAKADVVLSKVSPAVNEALKNSNLIKLIRGHEFSYALADARDMPVISSVGKDQMEEIIDFIQSRIYKDQMSADTEHVYGDAVSETINNVRLHAYPDSPPEQKRWWLLCNTFGKKLYLAIYDSGVGIPKTVVERPWFLTAMQSTHPKEYEQLLARVPGLESAGVRIFIPTVIPDESLIFYSMQGDVTGTRKEKHGQGSKSIKALVNDTEDGKLWVFSNKGVYTFNAEGQEPAMARLKKKFPGTLVQWNIELP